MQPSGCCHHELCSGSRFGSAAQDAALFSPSGLDHVILPSTLYARSPPAASGSVGKHPTPDCNLPRPSAPTCSWWVHLGPIISRAKAKAVFGSHLCLRAPQHAPCVPTRAVKRLKHDCSLRTTYRTLELLLKGSPRRASPAPSPPLPGLRCRPRCMCRGPAFCCCSRACPPPQPPTLPPAAAAGCRPLRSLQAPIFPAA